MGLPSHMRERNGDKDGTGIHTSPCSVLSNLQGINTLDRGHISKRGEALDGRVSEIRCSVFRDTFRH
jgi:hypothetical protein